VGYLLIKVRPRITRDGGASILVLSDDSPQSGYSASSQLVTPTSPVVEPRRTDVGLVQHDESDDESLMLWESRRQGKFGLPVEPYPSRKHVTPSTDPKPLVPRSMASGESVASTSNKAATAPRTLPGATAARPTADFNITALVDQLKHYHDTRKIPKPYRDLVIKGVRKRAFSTVFSDYEANLMVEAMIEHAQAIGKVECGGTNRAAWIRLRDEPVQVERGIGVFVTPSLRGNRISVTDSPTTTSHAHSSIAPSQVTSSHISAFNSTTTHPLAVAPKHQPSSSSSAFGELIEVLTRLRATGSVKPKWSEVAAIIPQSYKAKGYPKFKPYVEAAVEAGLVNVGGAGGNEWVSLR